MFNRRGFFHLALVAPLLGLFRRFQVKRCGGCGKFARECWVGFYHCDVCFNEVLTGDRDPAWARL